SSSSGNVLLDTTTSRTTSRPIITSTTTIHPITTTTTSTISTSKKISPKTTSIPSSRPLSSTSTSTTSIPAYTLSTVTTHPPKTQHIVTSSNQSSVLPNTALEFCPPISDSGISWPRTRQGVTVKLPCPPGTIGTAVFSCQGPEGLWDQLGPDLTNCTSTWVNIINQKIRLGEPAALISRELSEQTRQAVRPGDVRFTVRALGRLIDLLDVQLRNLTPGGKDSAARSLNKLQKRERSCRYFVQRKFNLCVAMVETVNNLLQPGARLAWSELSTADQLQSATLLLDIVEQGAFTLADNLLKTDVVQENSQNIQLEVARMSTDGNLPDLKFPQTGGEGNNIRLSANTLKQHGRNGEIRMAFVLYKHLGSFLSTENASLKFNSETLNTNYSLIVNSPVITAAINKDSNKVYLSDPVIFTLRHIQQSEESFNPNCSFWSYSRRTLTGFWSTQDCRLIHTNHTHTSCSCTHLTNFANCIYPYLDTMSKTMLTNFKSADTQSSRLESSGMCPKSQIFSPVTHTYAQIHRRAGTLLREQALKDLRRILLSLLCLLVCILTFSFLRNLQSDRNTIHKNLCVSLFIAETLFLTGINRTDQPVPLTLIPHSGAPAVQTNVVCAVFAALLHFFFLSAFTWMFLEGVQLYFLLVEVFESDRSRRGLFYLSGYGIPALIVAISAAVDYRSYGTDRVCWLRLDTYFIWSFIGPATFIIMIKVKLNMIFLGIALYKMFHHTAILKPDSGCLDNIKSWVVGAVALLCLLGLTWAFGLMYVNESSLVMAYLFSIFNSLQGLFIFIFHCLLQKKVRKELGKCLHAHCFTKKKKKKKSVESSMTSHRGRYTAASQSRIRRMWNDTVRKQSESSFMAGDINASTTLNRAAMANHIIPNSLLRAHSSNNPYNSLLAESAVYNNPTLSMYNAPEGILNNARDTSAMDTLPLNGNHGNNYSLASADYMSDCVQIIDRTYNLHKETTLEKRILKELTSNYLPVYLNNHDRSAEHGRNLMNKLVNEVSNGSGVKDTPMLPVNLALGLDDSASFSPEESLGLELTREESSAPLLPPSRHIQPLSSTFNSGSSRRHLSQENSESFFPLLTRELSDDPPSTPKGSVPLSSNFSSSSRRRIPQEKMESFFPLLTEEQSEETPSTHKHSLQLSSAFTSASSSRHLPQEASEGFFTLLTEKQTQEMSSPQRDSLYASMPSLPDPECSNSHSLPRSSDAHTLPRTGESDDVYYKSMPNLGSRNHLHQVQSYYQLGRGSSDGFIVSPKDELSPEEMSQDTANMVTSL
ncbi:hypothetical protein DNTS_030946, partial [Danionella cerebrum]